MELLHAVVHALKMSSGMGWEILWPLVLGFALSAVVQAVVSRQQMSRLLPDDKPKTLTKATLLGAASSSCSYAAVALARSLFQKGANFTSAMAFEIASTNLVLELGVILVVVLGWPFMAAEAVGAPVMIVILVVLFRRFLSPRLVAAAQRQAQKGLAGRMEGHAAMDMSIAGQASIWRKLRSPQGATATSHYFVMDWAAVWMDIGLGLLIAGAIAAWVPQHFFQSFFLSNNHLAAAIWGPLVGPLIAVVSFVCSVGNIPLAAVLWNGGMSFGGVVSFIFADLIVLPILRIYQKYYGWKMAMFLFGTFYAAMAAAGYIVEVLFALLRLTPEGRHAKILEATISWNYTTWLNIVFLVLAVLLVWRFLRTGGPAMLGAMNGAPGQHESDASPHQHEM